MRENLADLHPAGKFMADSPVAFVAIGDPTRNPRRHHTDTPVAIQNFLLAAYAQGLGTCWAGVFENPYEDDMKAVLGIPKELRIICTVAVGYPTENPTKDRRSLSEMISYEKYGP